MKTFNMLLFVAMMVCFGNIGKADGLRCDGQDGDCCTKDKPCEYGEGDCDSHDQCMPGLICGDNNCKGSKFDFGTFDDTDDCCTIDTTKVRCHGQDNDCCTEDKPCLHGEGHCHNDKQCKDNLYCGRDNCLWGGNCCKGARCRGENDDCCTEENPCSNGEGDCDNNNQCKGDLVCGDNNCEWGGNDGTDDCCVPPKNAYSDIAGIWRVTYPGGDASTYEISKDGEMTIVFCNWGKCDQVVTVQVQPSSNELLPAPKWYIAKPIHRSTVWLYFHLEDGKLKVYYFYDGAEHSLNGVPNYNNKGAGTGIKDPHHHHHEHHYLKDSFSSSSKKMDLLEKVMNELKAVADDIDGKK